MPRVFALLPLLAILGLAACSAPQTGLTPDGINDPYENTNRSIHSFNVGVDRTILRPAGQGYTRAVPNVVRTGVSNFADNLALPGTIVNQILQGRLMRAGKNTLRFTTNTLVGLGGLVDVASSSGLAKDESDFGETLHVWGVTEGPYVELPLLGPSTGRDAVGEVVDIALNPLGLVLSSSERAVGTGARVLDVVGARGESTEFIDSILYDSADSYSQLRIIYLQNRRFELGMEDSALESPNPLMLDTEGF